ncbi:MAG: hypothetical protein RQ756_05875, partial [Flavobacteriaceae bacterium]|nr:hypothetical protein [Flavobacteriaceae bacterium]
SMILIACILYAMENHQKQPIKYRQSIFWAVQLALLGFLCSLILVGWKKAYWRYRLEPESFSIFMEKLSPYFVVMVAFGIGLAFALLWLVYRMLKQYLSTKSI